MTLGLVPITYREACAFIEEHHRHHLPPQGYKFAIAVADGQCFDDGVTAEVTRCCTDGTKNACSKLYDAELGEWLRLERGLTTQTGKRRVECLWLCPRAAELSKQRTLFAEGLG